MFVNFRVEEYKKIVDAGIASDHAMIGIKIKGERFTVNITVPNKKASK
jgi:hypothetical protein